MDPKLTAIVARRFNDYIVGNKVAPNFTINHD